MNARKKILLVDDNDDSLDLLEVYLYNDYEIHTAQNGFEGLKTAQALRPDLIITDIMMPVMDGIRFFNELRKRDENRLTPVIVFTSFAETTTMASLRNVGFSEVMAKPFDREILVNIVSKLLEPEKSESPSEK